MAKKKNKQKRRIRKQQVTQREKQLENNGYSASLTKDFHITLDKASNPSTFSCKLCMKRYPTANILHLHENGDIKNNMQACIDLKVSSLEIEKTIQRNTYYDLRSYYHNNNENKESKPIFYKCRNCCRLFYRKLNMIRCEASCAPYIDKKEFLGNAKAKSSIRRTSNNYKKKRSYHQSPITSRFKDHINERNNWWFGEYFPQTIISDILLCNSDNSSYS